MPVPIVFRRGGEQNTTFDFYDVASGAGYKRFYCSVSNLTAGNAYYLTDQVNASPVTYELVQAPVAWGFEEFNFDLEFNKTLTVKGDAIFKCITHNEEHTSSYVVVTVYHVSTGAAETSLGTATSSTVSTADTVESTQYVNLKCALSLKTFNKGEKLRVEVKFYCLDIEGGFENDMAIYFNPLGTVVDGLDSSMTIDIPFRIDL